MIDMAVELRQLRTFIIVAEELHSGRATRRLFVTQSSVSQQLQRLEAELGVALLHRTSLPAVAGRHVHGVGIAALLRADRPLAGKDSLAQRGAAAYPHTVRRGGGARAIAGRVRSAERAAQGSASGLAVMAIDPARHPWNFTFLEPGHR